MQHTWHIIAFYDHKARAWLRSGVFSMSAVARCTKQHDAYLIEHDKSVSEFVSAQLAR